MRGRERRRGGFRPDAAIERKKTSDGKANASTCIK
jgi:hypothetical protein